jgi:hypothetical protein
MMVGRDDHIKFKANKHLLLYKLSIGDQLLNIEIEAMLAKVPNPYLV